MKVVILDLNNKKMSYNIKLSDIDKIIFIGNISSGIVFEDFKYIVESGVKYSVVFANSYSKYQLISQITNKDDKFIVYTNNKGAYYGCERYGNVKILEV